MLARLSQVSVSLPVSLRRVLGVCSVLAGLAVSPGTLPAQHGYYDRDRSDYGSVHDYRSERSYRGNSRRDDRYDDRYRDRELYRDYRSADPAHWDEYLDSPPSPDWQRDSRWAPEDDFGDYRHTPSSRGSRLERRTRYRPDDLPAPADDRYLRYSDPPDQGGRLRPGSSRSDWDDLRNRDDLYPSPYDRSPANRGPGRRGPIEPARMEWQDPYGPSRRGTSPANYTTTPADDIQQRITRRYQSNIGSLLALPPQNALALYAEVMNLIDARHLQPATPAERVQRGLTNLEYAVQNPQFLQANRLNMNPAQADAFRRSIAQWAAQSSVQSSSDAVTFAGWVANTSQQQYGVRASAVILEFVYAAGESLDKYSTFVPPERSAGASLQLEQSIVGIGVQLEPDDRGARIQKVFANSPAREAGLQVDDLIVGVGNRSIVGLDLDQTADLITGPEGSSVQLVVQRGSQSAFTVNVPRRTVQILSVNEVQMLGGNARVGYFKLEKFSESSAREVEAALWTLHRQGMQSLVMDLRGNPGGLLTAAIEISNMFLPQGTIVSTRGRTAADNTQEVAQLAQTWKVPLVVLIDEGSASASEIFAAAIQENGRGVIVGRRSYGKGTVQTQFPLKIGGASLRITTAKFYSPTGREMAGAGVEPDVRVDENRSRGYSRGGLDPDVEAAVSVAQEQVGRSPNLTQTRPQPYRGGGA